MNKKELLKAYVDEVNNIRARALKLNLSNAEIDEIFKQCFARLKERPPKKSKVLKYGLVVAVFGIVCYILLYVHQPTSSIVLRNVQGLIYPGLKFVRFLSMPVIKYWPSLTELYDETCLLENPYFYVNNMECWPCENVYSVINLTGFNNHTLYESGTPFIVKLDQKRVEFSDLQKLYSNNSNVFDKDANRIKSNKYNLTYAKDLLHFDQTSSSNFHISWRINRMLPARLLRRLFPRPYLISEWSGQSLERFIMVDGPDSPAYALPSFECSYIFMIQGSGERTIILKPSRECGSKCKTVSVILKPSYVLWYNWWYWRPISLPVENSTNISVSYISSYC